MGSLWTVELEVDRRRASPIFCGLARGEVRRAGVGVEESRSCELTDWALLRHGEEPEEGDAIVGGISRVGRARATSSIQRGLAIMSRLCLGWQYDAILTSRPTVYILSPGVAQIFPPWISDILPGQECTEHSSQDDGIYAAASPTAAIVAMPQGKERTTDGRMAGAKEGSRNGECDTVVEARSGGCAATRCK